MVRDIINIGFGGLVSALISWYFYEKAGKELREQVVELKTLNKLTIHILVDAGLVDPSALATDSNGNLTGGIKKTFTAGFTHTIQAPSSSKI
jgi:hypothetical protein